MKSIKRQQLTPEFGVLFMHNELGHLFYLLIRKYHDWVEMNKGYITLFPKIIKKMKNLNYNICDMKN